MTEFIEIELLQEVKRFLNPEPSISLVYGIYIQFSDVHSPDRLAQILAELYPEYKYLDPRPGDWLRKRETQKLVGSFLYDTPSVSAVMEIIEKFPEYMDDPKMLAKELSALYPKYRLIKDRDLAKIRARREQKKRKSHETKEEPKLYAKIIGDTKNYWVIAWKGWARSYVVNPRSLYSGLPKKYKTKSEAIEDCDRADCVLLKPEEYDKIAPKVPSQILWALEKTNQRPPGIKVSKHEKLVEHVAGILPGDMKGNTKLARVFLKDIENIFPGVKDLPNIVIIKAILITKRWGLTAEKTAKELRKMKFGYKGQPSYMKIIYTPM